ncbi:hypothetical protein J3E69DRAFT_334525 [Trichoderma sp. SZMC 28015]
MAGIFFFFLLSFITLPIFCFISLFILATSITRLGVPLFLSGEASFSYLISIYPILSIIPRLFNSKISLHHIS